MIRTASRIESTFRPAALFAFLAVGLVTICPSAFAQRPLGIDVSSYQGGSINWTSVKNAGFVFAWAKASEGTGLHDSTYVGNQNNGKAAGVIMGSYHYAHPENNTPAAEAAYFWATISAYTKADGLTLMPMLDIEGSAFSGHVGASSLSDWVNQWCTDIVQDAANNGVSVKPCIYVSACNACNFDTTVSQWGSDIANYSGNDPQTSNPWTACSGCNRWGGWNFWQYTSGLTVPGISGNVDHDVFNGTAAGLTSTMVATASTNSTIYYWDPQGTTGGNPYTGSMAGTWENAKWSYGSAGLASPVNWVNGKAVCFGVHTGIGTPAYTVTMNASHTVAGFFNGALTPNSCDVTIQGSGTINLASGPQALDSVNASDGSLAYLRIAVPIIGNGQLYPEGNGQSFLRGTNLYTGGTTFGYPTVVFSGTVNFNNDSAFGTGPIEFTRYGNNGVVAVEGTSAVTITNAVKVTTPATNNVTGNAAGLTFTGNWSIGANTFALGTGSSAANKTIIAGSISGTVGLRIFNAGTLVMSGVNTYSGTTTISSPAVLTIDGTGQLGSGSYANAIVNGGTFNYSSTATQTLSGIISGAGPVKVLDAGVLALTGVNTFSGGTTVSGGGTIGLNADSGLGTAAGALTLNNGCLKNNNSAPMVTSIRTITLGAGGGYFDAGWAPSNPLTINSKLTGAGALLVNLDGSPVVLGNTANNYTGNTIIGTNGPGSFAGGTQAWLKLGASSVIPAGASAGNVIINQAYLGMLDLAGFNQAINGLFGDGIVDNTTGNGSLAVGSNGVSCAFSGVIQNTTGALALTKVGAGTFTLSGANTYTGLTAVNVGKLALGAGGSIGASTVTVASAATLLNATTNPAVIGGATTFSPGGLGGFTAVGGSPTTIGKLTVNSNLTLNANTLTITVSDAALAVGSYRLLECTGTLTGSANSTPTISGIGLAGGTTATVFTTTGPGGHVDLVIKATPVFSNLTTNQSVIYGAPGVTLGGTISASGPLYPANGEPVSVTINGIVQTTTISDATGDFSINYILTNAPVGGSPYNVAYGYAGDAPLNSAGDSTRTLTVGPLPVVLGGTRAYNGTNDAAAAILSVSNALPGDVVSVVSGSVILAGSTAGVQPITSMGTLTLGGAASGNYTLVGASGFVTITATGFAITGEYKDNTGTNFIITWQSTPGTSYQVVTSSDPYLPVNSWTNSGDPITASGPVTSYTNSLGNIQSFFGVKSLP